MLYMDKYKTILMDCDGVILDSNIIKSEAFYQVAFPFGEAMAISLVSLNKDLGGISRFEKIRIFVNDILKTPDTDLEKSLLKEFGDICVEKLAKCNLTIGLIEFLDSIHGKDSFVVSGGFQSELRLVFDSRGLSDYFDGVYGSPETKKDIVKMLQEDAMIDCPCVFIGDSKSDYIAASSINSDFIFMSDFTEFKDWQEFFKNKDVRIINNLSDLI